MPHEVIMPALGMAQDTGVIVAWHKSTGDAVAEGDVLFEVETDKATMEVEAQAAGYLTQVRRNAGDDVPVGEVIALIGERADAVHAEETVEDAPAPVAEEMPDGNTVVMPALGMAQDTGLIVAWHKAPGDAVAANDILFEVETDKSTVEVEAGHDGFVAALLAEAGEEAPVGETIAVISASPPKNPIQQSWTGRPRPTVAKAEATVPVAQIRSAPAKAPEQSAPTKKRVVTATNGRILASPKARRLALEEGLDLARLAEAGHPQPYHVKDLDVLRALPEEKAIGQSTASRRLTAEVPSNGFAEFASWVAKSAGLEDDGALLAGLAATSLRRQGPSVVAVESFGRRRSYTAPSDRLGEVAEAASDETVILHLRDLRFSRIASVELGAEDIPVLTLTTSGDGLSLTLECASHHLTAAEAVSLLSEFAGRMEQPLRHLL